MYLSAAVNEEYKFIRAEGYPTLADLFDCIFNNQYMPKPLEKISLVLRQKAMAP